MTEPYPEPTPFDQPFPGASKTLKTHLLDRLNTSFADFKHTKETHSSMSAFLRLNEADLLKQAHEIGGKVATQMEQWVQLCSDYANGHGKIDVVQSRLEELRTQLRS
ncbi:MAG: hypothetical protein AAF443_02495 [Chlamydiota bacterium]